MLLDKRKGEKYSRRQVKRQIIAAGENNTTELNVSLLSEYSKASGDLLEERIASTDEVKTRK
jgi:hypothetical protein